MDITHELKKRAGIIALSIITLLLLLWYFVFYGVESTDDAYIKGNLTVISPKVMGYITEVRIKENQRVKAGQVIAVIDQQDYRIRVRQGTSQLQAMKAQESVLTHQLTIHELGVAQAEADLQASQANYDRALKEYHRTKALLKDGAISKQENDGATAHYKSNLAQVEKSKAQKKASESQVKMAHAQITQARAQIKDLEATLELAKIDLENTVVKAPKNGVLASRLAQVGTLARLGMALIYFIPDDETWIEANFKETQIGQMKPGQKVTIYIDAYPGQKFYGKVDSLSPASGSEFSLLPPENATGNFTKVVQRVPVKIIFDADKNYDFSMFRPGLSTEPYVKIG